jgi:hypothetical protein
MCKVQPGEGSNGSALPALTCTVLPETSMPSSRQEPSTRTAAGPLTMVTFIAPVLWNRPEITLPRGKGLFS